MQVHPHYRFPPDKEKLRQKARRLEWLSIVLLASAATALGFALGQSQTMKTAWIGDMLSIIPPIALLVAMRIETRPPTTRFPYGYSRAMSIAFLATAVVLTIIGAWLLLDAVLKLFHQQRPQIGTVELFGRQVWLGWVMCAALAYSSIVGFTIGTLKRPVAKKLHDKALEADADSNRADWMSEAAGIVGIVLVGFGLWWGDAAAAGIISINIVLDGWRNLRQVLGDLMDESPTKMGEKELEELPRRVRDEAEKRPWVKEAAVRLREHGHLLTGEVFVIPRDETDLVSRVDRLAEELCTVDWRLFSLTVSPTAEIEDGEHPPAAGGSE